RAGAELAVEGQAGLEGAGASAAQRRAGTAVQGAGHRCGGDLHRRGQSGAARRAGGDGERVLGGAAAGVGDRHRPGEREVLGAVGAGQRRGAVGERQGLLKADGRGGGAGLETRLRGPVGGGGAGTEQDQQERRDGKATHTVQHGGETHRICLPSRSTSTVISSPGWRCSVAASSTGKVRCWPGSRRTGAPPARISRLGAPSASVVVTSSGTA